MNTNITFYGSTEGVTGSNYLLEANGKKILVECGLFQGSSEEEKKNWENFAYNPSEIDYLVLTHSHLDHIGLTPKLYKHGFRGKIISTSATRDFAEIFLKDSCKILKNNAISKVNPPIYELSDVESCMKLFKTVKYRQKTDIASGVSATFYDAGHILGSAFIVFEINGKKILFSGDLGNPPVPIIKDTEYIKDIDYVIIESTYGDRLHKKTKFRRDYLEDIIEEAYTRRGTLLIPAFAMERTQELLYEINELVNMNKIPNMPVYIDSPLATKATQIYPKYVNDFDDESKQKIKQGDNLFNFKNLKIVESPKESKEICADHSPKIIIAGSGMSTGGRIIYHEMEYLPIQSTILFIVGYQVTGTLGRKLADKAKEVYINNKYVPVNAKVVVADAYSAHADQAKMIHWLSKMGRKKLKKVFLVHGEKDAKKTFRSKIQDELGVESIIAKTNMEVKL